MAYEPTEWKSKDVITSAKLNKIENALAGGVKVFAVNRVVTEEGQSTIETLDKTYQEIVDMRSVGIVFVKIAYDNQHDFIFAHNHTNGEYWVQTMYDGTVYTTDNVNGYPTHTTP